MLERRGATVLHGRVIRTLPLGPEAGLRAATEALVTDPPDVLVVTTGIGVRSWFASSWTWGLGDDLPEALAGTEIVARGPKAAAAILGEGLDVAWRAPDETLAAVLERLRSGPLDGRRVAVQMPGRRQAWFTEALRAAGADVVELDVYEWVLPAAPQAAERLVESLVEGEVDAVTFTCAYAVTNLLALAGPRAADVRARLAEGNVTVACVGSVTAAAAVRAGAAQLVVASPARLGAMVRALGEHLAGRAARLDLAGVPVVVQGARVGIGGTEVRLTRRERLLFGALLAPGDGVLSKRRLAQAAWETDVDEHTVEVAVNRLRRKLGRAAPALETTNRRGYRLVSRPLNAGQCAVS